MSVLPASCRGVFFDLYGTLLVYGDMDAAWESWLAAVHEGVRAAGNATSVDVLRSAVSGLLEHPEPDAALPGRTLLERRLSRAFAQIDVTVSAARLAALADAAVGAWQSHVSLDPVAHDVLDALRRHHELAIVTNFDHDVHVDQLLRENGLASRVRTVTISGAVGVAKPDPRVFADAVSASGLDTAQIAYVGDGDVDVDAAQNAGMVAVRIDRSANRSQGLVPTIRSLRELLPVSP